MVSNSEILEALRVASSTGQISPEIARAALNAIERPKATRRRSPRLSRRDELLRRAASHVQATSWNQLKAVEAEIARRFEPARGGIVESLVREALAQDPFRDPPSERQLRRILAER